MIGQFFIGETLIGGDADAGGTPPPLEINRHVTLQGDVDVVGIPIDRSIILQGDVSLGDGESDRSVTLHGDVYLSGVEIDRTRTLSGGVSVQIAVDRSLQLHGDVMLLISLDRTIILHGCVTNSAIRDLTFGVQVSGETARDAEPDDFQPVAPMTTFYT